jgi:hypothetical protein
MKGLTLERNHIYVSSVVKPSLNPVTFKHIQEVTLEKNPLFVSCVAKTSPNPVPLRNIKGFTLEKTLHVSAIWERLHVVQLLSKAHSS